MSEVAVTAIIPCFKHAHLVRRAAESALRNGCEVIVVDDCSPDDVAGALAGLPVKVIRHGRNLGLASCRNTAIDAATTPWILPLDADDELMPGGVNALLGGGGDVNYGNLIYPDDSILKPTPKIDVERFYANNQLFGTSLFRRELWKKIGGVPMVHTWYEDWATWWLMALAGAEFRYVDYTVYRYYGGPDGMCAQLGKDREGNVWAVRHIVEQRKQFL